MLTRRDAQLLCRLDLPVEHKEYLKGLWAENPQHRGVLEVLAAWLLNALTPAMCTVLIGALWYPQIQLTPLLRLTSFVVWILIVCTPLLMGLALLGFSTLVREPEKLRASLAKREGVHYAARRSAVGKVLVGFSIVLVGLLVMVGWTTTGIFYLLSWLVLLAIRAMANGAVQEGIKVVYEYERDRVRQARNVTPIT